jgi:hypothetical protein
MTRDKRHFLSPPGKRKFSYQEFRIAFNQKQKRKRNYGSANSLTCLISVLPGAVKSKSGGKNPQVAGNPIRLKCENWTVA